MLAEDQPQRKHLLNILQAMSAVLVSSATVQTWPALRDGVLADDFDATTDAPTTFVRVRLSASRADSQV